MADGVGSPGVDGAPPVEPPAEPSTIDRLVAAAGEVFAEEGYDGVRMQDIAKRAGLSTGAIYANFRGKAGLMLKSISQLTDTYSDMVDTTTDSRHGVHRSAADVLLESTCRMLTKANGRTRLLLMEAFVAARRDPQVLRVLRQRVTANTKLLVEGVERAKSEGDIDPALDTRAVVRLLQALRLGLAPLEVVDAPMPSDDAWRQVSRTVIRGLRPAEPTA